MAERPKRVLVAEDNAAMRNVICFALRGAGFEVTAAEDGHKAWTTLDTEDIDLVVSDFQMPRMSGGELCERMRGDCRFAQTPVILLTAKGYELNAAQYRDELSVSAIMSKPFSPRELAESVQHCLAAAATDP